ncbi:YraN family protein [Spongorhabdus nitratireducens]
MFWTLKNLSHQAKNSEDLALRYLCRKGLKLIARNYACRSGEIDLVMKDRQQLVFIEVRYRKDQKYGGALDSVTARKQQRIYKTAQHYLQQHNASSESCRFDVIALEGSPTGPAISWIKDAFQSF